MRILFVAISNSIHSARWIAQIADQGWDIHLFPSIDLGQVHPHLKKVTVHHSLYAKPVFRRPEYCDRSVKLRGLPIIFPFISGYIASFGKGIMAKRQPNYRVAQLERLIRTLRPDIIHSMEIQAAGYLVAKVRKQYKGEFPPWIVTNWGSDIYLFGRLAEHENRIREVMELCDYYHCECRRDVYLAQKMGLRGEVLPLLVNTGGFDLGRTAQLRQPGPTSARRVIVLKGYTGWAGRALVGLRAIELCASELQGYRVVVYLAGDDVKIAAELVSKSTGIPIDTQPYCSHEDMLRLYGRARVYIGLSISDAISTSLLEAMVMGAFPIQSCTSCADEWIMHGETGYIVPPEDPEIIATVIRKAVSDDTMVDHAADVNVKVARERLDQVDIKQKVVAMYQKVFAQERLEKGKQKS